MEQANRVLSEFLPRFNSQFGVVAAQPGAAYRHLPSGTCLDSVLCFKYIRTVANDNTVQFSGTTVQIKPDQYRPSYARADVEVQERLDGSIVVAYRGRTLAAQQAPRGPVEIRARSGRRANGRSHVEVSDGRSNGNHPRHGDDERRNGAKRPQGAHPHPTARTKNSTRKPAPNHPWRRQRLT